MSTFPWICSSLNIQTRKQLRVFGVNPFVKVIKLQLAVINKNVFIRLQLGCVRYLECLEKNFRCFFQTLRAFNTSKPQLDTYFLSSFNCCFVALKKGRIPKIRSFCIVALAFFSTVRFWIWQSFLFRVGRMCVCVCVCVREREREICSAHWRLM